MVGMEQKENKMKITGLSIQEAIQSGLPFKREKWPQFVNDLNVKVMVSNSDIIATDYLLDVPGVKITREKLENLIRRADVQFPKGVSTVTKADQRAFINFIAEELGL